MGRSSKACWRDWPYHGLPAHAWRYSGTSARTRPKQPRRQPLLLHYQLLPIAGGRAACAAVDSGGVPPDAVSTRRTGWKPVLRPSRLFAGGLACRFLRGFLLQEFRSAWAMGQQLADLTKRIPRLADA